MAQEIPQPPGVPILGNVFDVDPKNTWPSFKKLADEYGEIFKIQVLGTQIVFIANVALCEEICDETRFRKAVMGPIVEIRHSVHDSLFTAYNGEKSWTIAHNIMAPRLQPDFMHNYFKDVLSVATEFTTILSTTAADRPINIHDYLAREALEAISLALYGKKLGNMENPKHPMLDAMETSTSEAMLRPNRPGLLNRFFYQSKFDEATKAMRDFASGIVEYRRAHPELADRNDMLTALMKAKDPETGESLNEQRVVDEIVTLPIGLTTAPGLIATTVYYLLNNPACITKARQEIDMVVGSDELQFSHLDKLHYIDGIVKESMRLAAPAPGFNIEPIPSENKAPISLGGGKYEIPHNQPMITVLAAVNRDPAVYTDPETFDPERMLPEKFEKLPKGAKKFFGNGKRVCIGQHFAWNWCMVTLTQMLRDLDFEQVEPNYELKQDGWFNLRPIDYEVTSKARAKYIQKTVSR